MFSVQCSVVRRGTHANRQTDGFKLGRVSRFLASCLSLKNFVASFVASFVDKVSDNARDKAWGSPSTVLRQLSTVLTLLLLAAFAPRAAAGDIYAAGGTVTETNGYRTHTYYTTGNYEFRVWEGGGNVEVLVVAGGGGGTGGGAPLGGTSGDTSNNGGQSQDGPANSGAGGGARWNNATGRKGGSGIVVIRWQVVPPKGTVVSLR